MKVPVQPISEAAAYSENIGTAVDVHRLVSIFRRRLKLFVAVTALIFAGAALITFQQVPQYTATARVLIDQRKQQVMANDQTVMSGLPDEFGVVDTETEVLRSRSIAESVASEANLYNDPYWNGTKNGQGLLKTLFG